MLYFATYDFEHVTIHGHEAVAVTPGDPLVIFGTDYQLVQLAAETYAAQHNLMLKDKVRNVSYSPAPLVQA